MKKETINYLLAFAVCFLFSKNTSAQYYSKLYFDNHPSMLFGSVEVINDNMYVTGVTTQIALPYIEKLLFGKIHNNGTIVFINSIIDSNSYSYDIFLNSLKRTLDGNFIGTGYLYDTAYKTFLVKIDTLGNVLLWHEYSQTQTSIYNGMDITEVPGKGYLIAVDVEPNVGNTSTDVQIIRTDTAGAILNQRTYGTSFTEWPWTIRAMSNHHYMVGAFRAKNSVNTPYWSKTWLIEVDSLGNMVRQWLDNDATNLWPNGMQQTADEGWIIVRQHLDYDVNDFQAYNASILKLDKNFVKQWEIDTGGIAQDAGMYDVEILDDGSYICAGANPIDLNADSSHIYGWLMKVSSIGEIIWQNTYLADSTFGAFNYFNDVDLLPNGDIVACGKIESNFKIPSQQGWILRTDSNGCAIGCWLGIPDILPSVGISVYPNPFTNNLFVSSRDVSFNKAEFTITNPIGQTLYHQNETNLATGYTKMLDLSYLPNGLYVLQVLVNGERTVRQIVKQ